MIQNTMKMNAPKLNLGEGFIIIIASEATELVCNNYYKRTIEELSHTVMEIHCGPIITLVKIIGTKLGRYIAMYCLSKMMPISEIISDAGKRFNIPAYGEHLEDYSYRFLISGGIDRATEFRENDTMGDMLMYVDSSQADSLKGPHLRSIKETSRTKINIISSPTISTLIITGLESCRYQALYEIMKKVRDVEVISDAEQVFKIPVNGIHLQDYLYRSICKLSSDGIRGILGFRSKFSAEERAKMEAQFEHELEIRDGKGRTLANFEPGAKPFIINDEIKNLQKFSGRAIARENVNNHSNFDLAQQSGLQMCPESGLNFNNFSYNNLLNVSGGISVNSALQQFNQFLSPNQSLQVGQYVTSKSNFQNNQCLLTNPIIHCVPYLRTSGSLKDNQSFQGTRLLGPVSTLPGNQQHVQPSSTLQNTQYLRTSTPPSLYLGTTITSDQYLGISSTSNQPLSASNQYLGPSTISNQYLGSSSACNQYLGTSSASNQYLGPPSTSNPYYLETSSNLQANQCLIPSPALHVNQYLQGSPTLQITTSQNNRYFGTSPTLKTNQYLKSSSTLRGNQLRRFSPTVQCVARQVNQHVGTSSNLDKQYLRIGPNLQVSTFPRPPKRSSSVDKSLVSNCGSGSTSKYVPGEVKCPLPLSSASNDNLYSLY